MAKITFGTYVRANSRSLEETAKVGDILDAWAACQIVGDTDDAWEGSTHYLQGSHPFDAAGNEGIYETIARGSAAEPFRYLGRCRPGGRINLDPMQARRMFICSPFRSETQEGVARNMALAASACFDAFSEGWLPVAPHLYFPMFLPDAAPPCRYYGMRAGMMLMADCDAIRIYRIGGRLSAGQEEELHHATTILAMEPEIIDMTEQELDDYLAAPRLRQEDVGQQDEGPEPAEAADPEGEKKG